MSLVNSPRNFWHRTARRRFCAAKARDFVVVEELTGPVLTGPDANYAPARGGSESRNLAPLERLETRLEVETGFKQLLFEPFLDAFVFIEHSW